MRELIEQRGEMFRKYGKSRNAKAVQKQLEKARAKWTDDGWVIKGDLHLPDMGLKALPEIKSVGGLFSCSENELLDLAGSPEVVKGDFWCDENQLRTLIGGPKKVGGTFDCSRNDLRSLRGAPKTVGGDFRCNGNSEWFERKDVLAVSKVKGDIHDDSVEAAHQRTFSDLY